MAGGVKRRNHFLNTEPTMDMLPRSDAKTHRPKDLVYKVMVGKKVKMTVLTMNQAQSIAHQLGGWVSVTTKEETSKFQWSYAWEGA